MEEHRPATERFDLGTPRGMIEFMGDLMHNLIAGTVSPAKANAACNAADKIIRTAKLYHKTTLAAGESFLSGG